jgi:hypothetical protein
MGLQQDVAQEPEGGERPWERPGALRRDCEPHRARLIMALGGLAGLCALLMCLVGVTAPLAIGLGLAAWLMGRRDLARMRKGLMDPVGRWYTERGRSLGLSAAILGLLYVAVLLLFWWL